MFRTNRCSSRTDLNGELAIIVVGETKIKTVDLVSWVKIEIDKTVTIVKEFYEETIRTRNTFDPESGLQKPSEMNLHCDYGLKLKWYDHTKNVRAVPRTNNN